MSGPANAISATRLRKIGKLRGAFVRLGMETVVIIEVDHELLHDPFEAQVAITAIALTCSNLVVLAALHPCGCRELYGPEGVTVQLDAMPVDALAFHELPLDFTQPTGKSWRRPRLRTRLN